MHSGDMAGKWCLDASVPVAASIELLDLGSTGGTEPMPAEPWFLKKRCIGNNSHASGDKEISCQMASCCTTWQILGL